MLSALVYIIFEVAQYVYYQKFMLLPASGRMEFRMENMENSKSENMETSLYESVMSAEKTPKKKRKPMTVSIGTLIVCILLSAVFVFMSTFVGLKIFYEGEINRTFSMAKGLDFSKLSELEKLFEENYLYEVDTEAQKNAIAESYVYYSGDKYASYYSADEWAEEMAASTGNSHGIGVSIVKKDNGEVEVVQVMSGAPAEKAGVMVGDIIDSVEGVPASEIGFDGLPGAIGGEEGTAVKVGFIRGGEKIELSIIRGKYKAETIIAEMITTREGEKIGYIHITEFLSYQTTALDFFDAVDGLVKAGAEGLIFDVRNNLGGDLAAVVPMLDYLLPEGPIVHLVDKDGVEFDSYESGKSEIDLPMVVLTNGNSASAAELFTSSLMDYEKATIIGTKTYGKGCGQTGQMLSDGSVVFITNFLYNPPFSENYDGVGIIPDIEAELPEEWQNKNLFLLPAEEDTQLHKAVEVLASAD